MSLDSNDDSLPNKLTPLFRDSQEIQNNTNVPFDENLPMIKPGN